MGIVVEGASGTVGALVAGLLDRTSSAAAARSGGRDVRVLTTPSTREDVGQGTLAFAPSLVQGDAGSPGPVPAGWFGGVGSLVARVAADRALAPRAVHVAYGVPDVGRAWRDAGPVVRDELVAALLAGGVSRAEGESTREHVAVGRRLAWFPKPVGPAHAVAVPGHEVHALPSVPTVRTWLAIGSLRAELLQALGRSAPGGRVASTMRRRARRASRGSTAALRWAVVAEVRDGDDEVVRAWANGTDPRTATAGMLVVAARRAAGLDATAEPASVLEFGDAGAMLDELADLGALRWSVARPIPARR